MEKIYTAEEIDKSYVKKTFDGSKNAIMSVQVNRSATAGRAE